MAYTVSQLITGAYYASGVVSREFESVEGPQASDALIWLNEILGEKRVDDGMIPYETTYTLNMVAGQEEYTIPDCITIDTLTFLKDTVRYSMRASKRNEYFGSPRVENISSLPFEWYFERALGGGTLYIYFSPDEAYPITIKGVFELASVTMFQDLELTLDSFYITYLRYALADRICKEFNEVTPAGVSAQLNKLVAMIDKKSRRLDLRLQKICTLNGRRHGVNWGQVNIGRGWYI